MFENTIRTRSENGQLFNRLTQQVFKECKEQASNKYELHDRDRIENNIKEIRTT